jgi:hypothetical protein
VIEQNWGAFAWPNWAPKSRSIVTAHFLVDYSGSDDTLGVAITTMRPDGSGLGEPTRPGAQLGYFDEHPAWAPAGGQIVYDEFSELDPGSGLETPRGIWTMNGDGSNATGSRRRGPIPTGSLCLRPSGRRASTVPRVLDRPSSFARALPCQAGLA